MKLTYILNNVGAAMFMSGVAMLLTKLWPEPRNTWNFIAGAIYVYLSLFLNRLHIAKS